jgi:ferric-dicitrate binding protein FerR (iron transport regulator)
MEDKFTTHSSLLLSGEDYFVRWVLHGEYDEQWKAWIQHHQDRQHVIEEARKIVLSISASPSTEITRQDKEELWDRIHSSIKAEAKKPAKNNLRSLLIWTVSAAAAFALLVWINNLTAHERILAHIGEQKEFLLPEQSAVTLNAGSTIMYRERSFDQDRVLRLEGEAFFKVKPGSTFKVETDYGTVTVLGTSFNVLSREGRLEVSCFSGKVKVETKANDQVIITPGQKTIHRESLSGLNSSSFTLEEEQPAWIAGRFSFENQPLSEVVAELERQYAIKVNLDAGLGEMKYTGLFEAGNLEKALSLITWPLHLKSSVKGKTVTISR